jgi:UDP-glucose 4-epimerase
VKRILITGGAGFVGSNLAKLLVKEHGWEVTVLDDFFTGTRKNLEGLDLEIVEGSVTDEEKVASCIKNKDIVFHLAARNIIVSTKNPLDDMQTNIRGTYNILSEALKANTPKVLYTSTCSIYGNPRHLPINEDETPSFLNFYSVSKFAGEGYAKTFYEQFNLPVTIVRYSNVFGPNQSPSNPYCGVIGKFIHNALRNEPLQIHGDGEQTRDFTYVEDACKATLLAALDPKAVGDTFNIGTGVECSVNKLAKHIVGLSQSKSEIKHIDKRDIDNIRRRVLNIEKIRYKLRFFPSHTLDDGLKKTIQWYNETKE